MNSKTKLPISGYLKRYNINRFGIFLVIVVEMAQITPPVGFNLFVLQGMANKDMGFIARSAFPLFMLMILAVILVVIFPEIALWMPQQMVQNIN